MKLIENNADIGKVAGDVMASFSDLHCLQPRYGLLSLPLLFLVFLFLFSILTSFSFPHLINNLSDSYFSGRLDVELFPTILRLHGKTHDYQLKYDTITHLFLLEKSDERNMLFAVGLDPPLRQGQTRYPFLVFQFPIENEEEEFKVNITE